MKNKIIFFENIMYKMQAERAPFETEVLCGCAQSRMHNI